jgi:amino acid transporter
MSQAAVVRPDVVARTLARNRLGAPAVVFFVLSAAAPLTVTAGVVTTGFAVTGIVALPLAFAVVGAVLALFSVGYVAMARHVGNAGAFYAYIARGLGRPYGVGAAWVALLAYNALQWGLYGAIGAATLPLLDQWFGLTVPWWLVAGICAVIVGGLGLLRVDVNGTVLAVLLLAEIAVIIVYSAAFLLNPSSSAGSVSLDALNPATLATPGVGAILALAVLGFVGFESAVVFSEESRNPRRTVRAATYASVALIGILYTVAAWAMTVTVGPDQIVAAAGEQGPELLFGLAATHLGGWAATVGHVLFATSLVAAMIAFHNTVARYAFSLGRERVLPRWLGTTSRTGAPLAGSLLQTALGLTVITIYAAAGRDPLVQLFFWLGTSGAIGILLLLATTAVAVVAFLVRTHTETADARHGAGTSLVRQLAAPIVSLAALLAIAYLAVDNIALLLGVNRDSPLPQVVPSVYLGAAMLGILWGVYLKLRRPDTYRGVGMGAKAATTGLGLTLPSKQHPNVPDHVAPSDRSR